MIKNDTETEDEELQESGDKRLKVPDGEFSIYKFDI